MSLSKSFTALAVIGAAASAANAALVPSWRVNTINAAALAQTSQLQGAISVSLLVTTTAGSSWGTAGLDFDGLFGAPTTVGYYQRTLNNGTPPDPGDFDGNPALEFDTYVATADPGSASAIAGRLNGVGSGLVGQSNLNPAAGSHRIGQNFNVAWGIGATNIPAGTYEIARITFKGVSEGFTPVPLSFGLVTDNLDPGTNIALPPIPVVVPEPMSFALAGLGLLALRRK